MGDHQGTKLCKDRCNEIVKDINHTTNPQILLDNKVTYGQQKPKQTWKCPVYIDCCFFYALLVMTVNSQTGLINRVTSGLWIHLVNKSRARRFQRKWVS